MLNFSLTPEQIELRDKARRFAVNEVLPIAWHYDEKDELPLYILKRAWDEGIMNLTIPAKFGGQGRGLLECALVVEEISAACVGTRHLDLRQLAGHRTAPAVKKREG